MSCDRRPLSNQDALRSVRKKMTRSAAMLKPRMAAGGSDSSMALHRIGDSGPRRHSISSWARASIPQGAVQHVVRGELCEDRHTREMMPMVGNHKNVAWRMSLFLVWGEWSHSSAIKCPHDVGCDLYLKFASAGTAPVDSAQQVAQVGLV